VTPEFCQNLQVIYYTSLLTPIGNLLIASTPKGICRMALGEEELINQMVEDEIIKDEGYFSDILKDLEAYFAGKPVEFRCQLDLREGTGFQRRVWEEIRRIPYGQVWSYKRVAEVVGNPKAPRAVGGALRANPIPIIIPCHRVIASDGTLGGYSLGLDVKRWLLGLEGVKLKG